MNPTELATDYRRQLAPYLQSRDIDRVVPILLKPLCDRTDGDRAILTDAAGIIRYIKSR